MFANMLCCPAIFGPMVEEIAAAGKANNNHISTTHISTTLFSLAT
jgi:hypothetical protein